MRVGDLIKSLRKEKKMTQSQLARKLGVVPTAVSAWERNENRPLMDKLSFLAELFDVPLSRFFESDELGGSADSDLVRLPVVGRVSFGDGVFAYDEISGYESTPREWLCDEDGEYFYLRAQDDSMSGARIQNGDLLLIKTQSEVENGEIAAALVEGKTVLKRVYKNGEQLVFQSENQNYPPVFAPRSEIKIIGKLKINVIRF